MDTFVASGGGFLVAVIWMDLMFDVLALRSPAGAMPEKDLAKVATYYRRVTTDAQPMNRLIGAVMTAIVGTLAFQLATGDGDATVAAASLALCGVPIVLALTRVFPGAMRLGARADDAATQSLLARRIAVDHVFCFVAMVAFTALRIAAS